MGGGESGKGAQTPAPMRKPTCGPTPSPSGVGSLVQGPHPVLFRLGGGSIKNPIGDAVTYVRRISYDLFLLCFAGTCAQRLHHSHCHPICSVADGTVVGR